MKQNILINQITKSIQESINVTQHRIDTTLNPTEKYIIKIGAPRINRLFKILLEKEKNLGQVLSNLNLISFRDLIEASDKNKNASKNNSKVLYETEIAKYLRVEKSRVVATDEFIVYLNAQSDQHSFSRSRNTFKKAKITKV